MPSSDQRRPRRASPTWRPEGWPRPSRLAAAWLDAALRLAQGEGVGFVEVEHLARTLPPGGGPRARRLRLAPGGRVHALDPDLLRATGQPLDLRGTERLRRLGAGLRVGFDLDDVCLALARDPGHPSTSSPRRRSTRRPSAPGRS